MEHILFYNWKNSKPKILKIVKQNPTNISHKLVKKHMYHKQGKQIHKQLIKLCVGNENKKEIFMQKNIEKMILKYRFDQNSNFMKKIENYVTFYVKRLYVDEFILIIENRWIFS